MTCACAQHDERLLVTTRGDSHFSSCLCDHHGPAQAPLHAVQDQPIIRAVRVFDVLENRGSSSLSCLVTISPKTQPGRLVT